MKRIVGFFLDHKMLVNLIIVVIVMLGIRSLVDSKKEGFPDISMNQVIIETIYPGASSRDVELNLTVPIEQELEEVEGIKEILSTSSEGVSRIIIQADDNATRVQFRKLYSDVEAALGGIKDLPEGIEGQPSISEFTSADIPILEVAYSGTYEKLKPYLDRLEKKIRRLPGVSGVDVVGLPDREVQILVNPRLARKHRVDLRMIAEAIKKRNLEGSGGTLESFTSEKKVVFLSKFENYRSVLDTNIFMGPDGFGVKLKQVADIKILPEDLRLSVRNNGKPGATLSIRKNGTDDLIQTAEEIHELLRREKLPPGVESKVLLDQSLFTRGRISLLAGNALIGFLLVVGLLLYVFGPKTAVWTAFGIPFTLLGLFIVLKNSGISLNLISLGGFVIIIGMLVDDAIVIAEEISSNKEKGMPAREAAVAAVQTMWRPVLAASSTTMLAFSPLLALGGFPGKFIWTIPLMVVVGLLISLFESFFILPSHLYHGKQKTETKKAFIVKLEKLYGFLLGGALRYRYQTLMVFILLFLVSVFAIKNFAKRDPFPQEAAEGFNITITLPRGTSREAATREIRKVEKQIAKLPKKELLGFSTRIGTHSLRSAVKRGTQSNIAVIFVYLTPYGNRARTAGDIVTWMTTTTRGIFQSSESHLRIDLQRIGPPLGRPFEIRIISNRRDLRTRKETEIRAYLKSLDGVYEVDSDEVEGKNELNLKINYDILSQAGLNVADVLTTLRIAFDGLVVTDMTTVDRTTAFRLRLNPEARKDMNFVKNLPLVNRLGNKVNLNRFASITEQKSAGRINHVNGERSLTVFGNVDLKKTDPVSVVTAVKAKFPSSEEVRIEYAGQAVENKLIFSGLGSAALIAVIGIYLLIGLIFNSYSKPFLIMLPLPFLVIGLAFVILTHGLPISMMAGVAMVGLMGIVINDSIVMVHKIQEMAPAGEISRDVILSGAVSRLRPVVLTSVTTILGVLPTGYGIGGYDPFLSQMSIVLAYGLLFSTVVILYIVPIFHAIGLDIVNALPAKIGKPAIIARLSR